MGNLNCKVFPFCLPYHCKKGIPYSQALRLSRICSDNQTFDKGCNDSDVNHVGKKLVWSVIL